MSEKGIFLLLLILKSFPVRLRIQLKSDVHLHSIHLLFKWKVTDLRPISILNVTIIIKKLKGKLSIRTKVGRKDKKLCTLEWKEFHVNMSNGMTLPRESCLTLLLTAQTTLKKGKWLISHPIQSSEAMWCFILNKLSVDVKDMKSQRRIVWISHSQRLKNSRNQLLLRINILRWINKDILRRTHKDSHQKGPKRLQDQKLHYKIRNLRWSQIDKHQDLPRQLKSQNLKSNRARRSKVASKFPKSTAWRMM